MQYLTVTAARILVLALWLLPALVLAIPFAMVPGQGFLSRGCSAHAFLGGWAFRATYSAVIVVSVVAILVLYACFNAILWCGRDVTKTSIRYNSKHFRRYGLLLPNEKYASLLAVGRTSARPEGPSSFWPRAWWVGFRPWPTTWSSVRPDARSLRLTSVLWRSSPRTPPDTCWSSPRAPEIPSSSRADK